MPSLTITDIRIYPVKSLAGLSLPRAIVMRKGLQHDRRWMLIDKDGVAMTQRVYPQMALFKPDIHGNEISIAYKKDQKVIASVAFDLSSRSGTPVHAQVWNDDVDVLEPYPKISEWFSRHLDTACRLVTFPEENPRAVDPRYSRGDENVSLADAYPFLIIGQSSLDDLNKRLAQPLPMNRFRPNFIFTGGNPYAEDDWKQLSIGKIRFLAAKKSDRCVMTTVDQDTAEKGSEPLRTLSSYRKLDNKVYFGQNLIGMETGVVAVGDTIIPA